MTSKKVVEIKLLPLEDEKIFNITSDKVRAINGKLLFEEDGEIVFMVKEEYVVYFWVR